MKLFFDPSHGIRQRLLLWLMPPLTAIFLVSVASDYRFILSPATDAYDQALLDAALAVSGHLRLEEGRFSLQLSPQADSIIRTDGFDQIYYAVHTKDGGLIAGDPNLEPVEPDHQGPLFYDGVVHGAPIRGVVYVAPSAAGDVTVQVAETTKKRERLRRRVLTALIGPAVLLSLAIVTLVLLAVRAGLGPLTRLREEVEQRSPQDLRPIDLANVPGEVRPLVEALNRLFSVLSESSAAQQRFLADAAHQLRTPLSALQTQLELAILDQDDAQRRARLQQIEEATRRVTHLVHQLLALARSEPAAAGAVSLQRVDLAQIAEQIASSHLDRAITRNIDLGFELKPVQVDGVSWLLHEALANLVDNAIAYTEPGGWVTVHCGLYRGAPFLEVEDNGPGIPPEERDKVLQRFYRLAGSPSGGCGLGLAIVAEIARLHNATVHVEAGSKGRGTRIALRFRAAAAVAATTAA